MATIAGGVDWKAFIIARVTRIYPPYWFYTLIVLGIWLAAPQFVNSSYDHPASVWRSFLLAPNDVDPLLVVGWTLIHEMYFYVGFTFLLAFGILGWQSLITWGAAVAVLNTLLGGSISKDVAPTASLLLHPMTIEFLVGALIGLAVKAGRTAMALPSVVLGSVGLLWVLLLLSTATAPADSFHSWRHLTLAIVPCALIVYGSAAMDSKTTSRRRGIGVRLGDASYSIYLSHLLVISALGRLFTKSPIHGHTVEAAMIVLCLFASNAVRTAKSSLH